MTTYVIDREGVTVAVNEDKDEAIRLAREQYPNDVLTGTVYENGREVSGFLVGLVPF
jgi:hypothetical protein